MLIKSVDFGGGFGVPESDTVPELDIDVLHDLLADLFSRDVNASETKFGLISELVTATLYFIFCKTVMVSRKFVR